MQKSIFAVAFLGFVLAAPQAMAGHGHGRHHHHHGGGDPWVPFVVGAVTGVVIGQAMSQPEERVIVERRYYAPPPPPPRRVRVVKEYYYERDYPPPSYRYREYD